ncbi:MAG: sigma-70 family RNA polymerase sigma factor [Bacteroidota bacterium]
MYAPALMGIVTRILKDDELAEEALKRTFIEISASISKYDGQKGRIFTWMAAIARNTAIDLLRMGAQNQTVQDLNELGNESNFSHQNQNPKIIEGMQLVETSAEPETTILDSIYFNGYTSTEVTQKLNVSLDTLKTRIRTEVTSLRK